jgi:hypothetical protein
MECESAVAIRARGTRVVPAGWSRERFKLNNPIINHHQENIEKAVVTDL